MFASLIRLTSRTTYHGARGSGAGSSGKTSARSSPASRNTAVRAMLEGQTVKRSQRGLFHGTIVQFGNTIPKSRHKTSRTWSPNVQPKRLWSELLQRFVETRVTTKALRTIKKYGGLDSYIAHTKDDYLGAFGRSLRSEMASVAQARPQHLQKQNLAQAPASDAEDHSQDSQIRRENTAA